VSGQKWPLGSEVRRKDLTGGVMLYDASRAGNAAPGWFDASYWKERNEVEGEARGRGATYFVRTGRQQFVLRHYRRGGLFAKVLGDRYLWRSESATRAFAEWQLLYHLHRAGLPVPAPIAARYVRSGLGYRGDLITRRIDNATTFADLIKAGHVDADSARRIGAEIAAFHAAGADHADLNAHNILVTADRVWIVDFDRGDLRTPDDSWRRSNLERLHRSCAKVLSASRNVDSDFGAAVWSPLMRAYDAAFERGAARALHGVRT
jgi:3-deoxy-D-manno-octulosonic acid kinase